MVRSGKKAVVAGAVALCVAGKLSSPSAFVPAPLRGAAAPVAAASAAAMFAPAAHADEIGDAAKKLGDASYAFAKEVDWNNGIFLQAPGKFQPLAALKAIDKMMIMGAAMDPKLLKEAGEVHHKAILAAKTTANGVTTRGDWDAVNAAIGRLVASVPEKMVMDVYESVAAITDPGVPKYMKSLVNAGDAQRAYDGFLEFKDVVKANQVSSAAAAPALPSDSIAEAASALSKASYPFLKEVDWLSDVYLKPMPSLNTKQMLTAIDKMIVMGAAADGDVLRAATAAHHKAVGSIDAKGVTSLEDYTAVNNGIGHIIASVPKDTVMDVYKAMSAAVPGQVPLNMFSKVNPQDANAAAKAFYEFKDVVAASR